MLAMKKQILILLSLLPTFISCCKKQNQYDIYSLSTEYFSSLKGKVRIDDKNDPILSPFNTVITGKVLAISNTYSLDTYKEIQKEFNDDFSYYHALLDRHYDYKYFEDENGKIGNEIINVKKINESYGTEKEIVCDEFLYDVLKESYNFTINSNLKFNMFLGTVNDIYEKKMSSILEKQTSLNRVMSITNKALFADDFDNLEIQNIVSTIPNTVEEVKNLLTFNDEKKTVIFHKLDKAEKLEISLGGNGKGYATEKISKTLKEKYPEIALTINSGSSSIKTIGKRPDNKAWNISYTNPVYREALGVDSITNPYNPCEVALKYTDEFNLSTSGYYEQYFYTYTYNIERRCHIIDSKTGFSHQFFDQVSVLISNAGLADMYTTALFNTDSVKECNELFNNLNSIYNQENACLIMCYKSVKNNSNELYQYNINELKNSYEYNGKIYPEIKLGDGSIYQGDYNDIDIKDINDGTDVILSSVKRTFNETYVISENLKDKFYFLDSSYTDYILYPDNIISNIEVLK